MNIPTDYAAGYENARAIAPDVAAKYIAHHAHRRPSGRSDGGRPRRVQFRRVEATRRSGYE